MKEHFPWRDVVRINGVPCTGHISGTSEAPILVRDQRVTAHPNGVTKDSCNGGQSVEKPPGVECSTQGLAAEEDHAHPQTRKG